MRGRRVVAGSCLVALAVVAALAGARAAGSQAAGTLAGEFLVGSTGATGYQGEVDCNPAGVSTLTATATGPAFGPYPGTFEETATVTVGGGQVLSAQAEFTIFSGDTRIEGTKELLASPSGVGACQRNITSTTCTESFFSSSVVTYTATIVGPTGTSTTSGTATLATPATFQGACGATEVVFGQISQLFSGPTATPRGRATGGGEIERPVTGTAVTFGFNAHSDDKGTKGRCSIVDHATGEHVLCRDVTSYTQSGNHVVFSGNADVDGVPTTYRIDVVDNGSSGIGEDTFAIETDSGFVAAGVLTAGNVMVND
jgi:hypothetical protein